MPSNNVRAVFEMFCFQFLQVKRLLLLKMQVLQITTPELDFQIAPN